MMCLHLFKKKQKLLMVLTFSFLTGSKSSIYIKNLPHIIKKHVFFI